MNNISELFEGHWKKYASILGLIKYFKDYSMLYLEYILNVLINILNKY